MILRIYTIPVLIKPTQLSHPWTVHAWTVDGSRTHLVFFLDAGNHCMIFRNAMKCYRNVSLAESALGNIFATIREE